MPDSQREILPEDDFPSLPSDSTFPHPKQIVETLDHPAWFRPDDQHQDKYFLSYIHHGGQLPSDTPDSAWASTYGSRINIRYDNYNDALRFKPDRHLDTEDCPPLSQTLTEFSTTIRKELQQRHQLLEALRFRELKESDTQRIPSDLAAQFRETYGSIYMLHNASESELLDIPQLGEKRLEAIRTNIEHDFNPPTWAIECKCPRCDAFYTDAFRSQTKRTVSIAQQLTYCPACLNDAIPSELIIGPRNFNPGNNDN